MKFISSIVIASISLAASFFLVIEDRKDTIVADLAEKDITVVSISATPFTTCDNKWGKTISYDLTIKNEGSSRTLYVTVCHLNDELKIEPTGVYYDL